MTNVSKSNFDRTLEWFSPDREQAAQKYLSIRQRIIEILASRGCYEAEYWADVVIDRVVSKIDKASDGYEGDPAFYFCAVAKKVFLEYLKKRPPEFVPPPPSPPDDLAARNSSNTFSRLRAGALV
jgi:hypothetical protein